MDPREFNAAQDIAVLADGAVAVADTGNAALKVFSPYPHALLAVWTGLGTPTRVATGTGELLWVIDSAGHRVLGVARNGETRVELPRLTAPLAIGVDPPGALPCSMAPMCCCFPHGRSAGHRSVRFRMARASPLAMTVFFMPGRRQA